MTVSDVGWAGLVSKGRVLERVEVGRPSWSVGRERRTVVEADVDGVEISKRGLVGN